MTLNSMQDVYDLDEEEDNQEGNTSRADSHNTVTSRNGPNGPTKLSAAPLITTIKRQLPVLYPRMYLYAVQAYCLCCYRFTATLVKNKRTSSRIRDTLDRPDAFYLLYVFFSFLN